MSKITGSKPLSGPPQDPDADIVASPRVADRIKQLKANRGPGQTVSPPIPIESKSLLEAPTPASPPSPKAKPIQPPVPPAVAEDLKKVETLKHDKKQNLPLRLQALQVYDQAIIPEKTTIVLSSTVFDGIGDLEHVMHAARHLLELRKREPFGRLAVVLKREEGVPENAWEIKLRQLRSLIGEENVFIQGERNPKAKALVGDKVIINVSCPLEFQADGFISEYGMGNKEQGLNVMLTGLQEDTAGIWMQDDLAFDARQRPLSDALQKLVFGDILDSEQLASVSVGVASLRTDPARLAWAKLRLSQVPSGNNCTLVMSAFKHASAKQDFATLVKEQGFQSICWVDKDGEITIEGDGPPTVRVVNAFINDDDYIALLHLAHSGSLGGAGDTSFVRSFSSPYPAFVEARGPKTLERLGEAVAYAAKKGFPLSAQWLKACARQDYAKLDRFYTKELVKEWQGFRQHVVKNLEIGPWIDRYVRRSILYHAAPNELLAIEQELQSGKIDIERYETEILKLIGAAKS